MTENNLNEKVVVITGGGTFGGIGFAIAENCLKKGAKVTVLLDVNETQGEETAKYLCDKYGVKKAVYLKCDVTKDLENVFTKVKESFKAVDILVNNAGISHKGDVQKTIDINLTSVILWSSKFMEHTRKDKNGNGGTILNVASILSFRVEPYSPVYTASKFAVWGYTKSLGHKNTFKNTGVRVVAICPGYTETNLAKGLDKSTWECQPFLEDDYMKFLKRTPWQKPDAVGVAAVEVLEKAETGSCWLAEGGKPAEEIL